MAGMNQKERRRVIKNTFAKSEHKKKAAKIQADRYKEIDRLTYESHNAPGCQTNKQAHANLSAYYKR